MRHNLVEVQRIAASYYDSNRTSVKLKIGDTVLLLSPARKNDTSKKLSHFNHGQYEILEQTGPNNFSVTYSRPGNNTRVVVNAANLKGFHHKKDVKLDSGSLGFEVKGAHPVISTRKWARVQSGSSSESADEMETTKQKPNSTQESNFNDIFILQTANITTQ